MSLSTTETTRFGCRIKSHLMEVPWDHQDPSRLGSLPLFAREIIPAGGENYPALVYLQGGPGHPTPRPLSTGGWLGEALKHYRVILLDQRGTGRSGRIDAQDPAGIPSVEKLRLLRAPQIVADCELLREALGEKTWSLYGQSFGGFCITAYLSAYPDAIEHAYLTGGLPATGIHADDLYRATYEALEFRHKQFYAQIPFAEERIREISHHLENSDERVADGGRLSARRFRTLGIALGRAQGFDHLGYLLEEPFHKVRGEKALRGDFLEAVSQAVSFQRAPLYAVIHEAIYGGNAPGSTNWAAHRMREEFEGFEENADPLDRSAKFYLTGEHIYPWQFEEDPALIPFAEVAEELAQVDDWEAQYDVDVLKTAPAVCAAAVYHDDIFVPLRYSLETAGYYRDLRPWITNEHQHDGVAMDGAGVFGRLYEMVREY